jgi:uncharacterized protein (DUF58 family)
VTVPRSPLTGTGIAVAGGVVVLTILSFVTGYFEFLVPAIAGAVLLAVAFGLPRISSPLLLERRLTQSFVERGGQAEIVLSATSGRSIPPVTIIDNVAGAPVRLELSGIKALRTVQVTYRATVRRRGIHQIGPMLEERRDPFSLAVRTTQHPIFDELWVHPKIHPLRNATESFEDRMMTQAMRSISDDPLAEFQSLRDYNEGDDPRRIHWTSSARTGRIVVRDLLELRRRERHILLDTLDSSYTAREFEDAVEIAASLAVAGLEGQMQVVTRTCDPDAPGRPAPVRHRLELLELFTRVNRVAKDRAVPPQRAVALPRTAAQLIVVTGANSPLVPFFCKSPVFRRIVFFVRVSDRAGSLPKLPVGTLDVRSAEEFVQAYDGRRRRAA